MWRHEPGQPLCQHDGRAGLRIKPANKKARLRNRDTFQQYPLRIYVLACQSWSSPTPDFFWLKYLIYLLKLLFLNPAWTEFLSLISKRPNRGPFAKCYEPLLPFATPSSSLMAGTHLLSAPWGHALCWPASGSLPFSHPISMWLRCSLSQLLFFFSFITQELLWIKCNTYCLLKRSELFIITVFLISDRNDSRKTFFKECKLSIRCISGSPKTLLGVLKVRVWYLEWITNRELLYRTGNSAQCYVAPWMGRELREE